MEALGSDTWARVFLSVCVHAAMDGTVYSVIQVVRKLQCCLCMHVCISVRSVCASSNYIVSYAWYY